MGAPRRSRPELAALLAAFGFLGHACASDKANDVDAASSGTSGHDAGVDGSNGSANPLSPSLRPVIDTDPAHYPSSIWVTGDMAKVQPADPPGPLHWAVLSAARNEIESFQVHVHADTAIDGLAFEVGDLHDAQSGASIAAANVTVSSERYLAISPATVSDANGVSGEIPDALVPQKDLYFGEPRDAFAGTLVAGRNASAWIDVYVPPGTPSGWYTGTVTVRSGASRLATLPILLKLWNVDLPSTATLRSEFGLTWNGACVQEYGSYDACGAAVPSGRPDDGVEYFRQLYATFALNHRVSLGGVVYAGPATDDWAHFDGVYASLLDGTARTQLPGARLTSIVYTGDPADQPALRRWRDHFDSKGWLDRLVFYHCDEPEFSASCRLADALVEENDVHAVAADFRTLLTARIEAVTTAGLLDAVDVLTPVVEQMQPHGEPSHRPAYDAFLARSARKRLFWYQSCDEHESCEDGPDGAGHPGPATATWPSYMADATTMRNRVFQWMAYVFGVQGELYYRSDGCFSRLCGPKGAQTSDPLVSIYAGSGNGDGTLFYPGRPAVIGGTRHIPLSSIRFELIREGMEDYELLHLLDAAGEGAFAMQQARSFIRRADDFDADAAHLLGAREALGDRLHARSLATLGAP